RIEGALLSIVDARGQGFIDIVTDPDGSVRRAPLLARCGGGLVPSLPLRAACAHLGVSPNDIDVRLGDRIDLGGQRTIPIDARGMVRVDYPGPWGTYDHYAIERILDPRASERELLRRDLNGRVVIVADLRTAVGDVGPTPYGPNDPLAGVHAAVLESILRDDYIREASLPLMLAIELLLLVLLAWFARLDTRLFLAGAILLALLYLGATYGAFAGNGVILHVVRPLLALGFATVLLQAYRYVMEERRRAVVQASFEAYFAPALARQLLADPQRITLGGRRKELTVLFSDMAGFTTLTADMEPEEIQQMLNTYFEAMVDIVFEHGGVVDKIIGDGLMVFFGDPEEQPDHAQRAVNSAIAMQHRMEAIADAVPVKIRVGINTGSVVVGNMGSPRRLSYTALGSEVSLAARLEPHAPNGGILISKATRDALGESIETRAREPLKVKGFPRPIEVFEVVL
ncbi:MAG: adenylate/guanylate cyclase domain-containing protein, partial [Planctomycetota bacterium]|nr:adenylate/guanylate cyclase domain-containing protein [Planctomycetota bacterium]